MARKTISKRTTALLTVAFVVGICGMTAVSGAISVAPASDAVSPDVVQPSGDAAVTDGRASASEGSASADSKATPVTSCTVITSPGNYTLASDLSGDGEACLVVDSDGVTVDGDNHSVVQSDSDAVAVSVTGVNVTVRDVRVTGAVEYSSGEGSRSRTTASGGSLFINAQREPTENGVAVRKTVRVSDGGRPAAGLLTRDGELPFMCGFQRKFGR